MVSFLQLFSRGMLAGYILSNLEMKAKVIDVDVDLPQATYTFDLLSELSAASPGIYFSFIVGSDWLQPHQDMRFRALSAPDSLEYYRLL